MLFRVVEQQLFRFVVRIGKNVKQVRCNQESIKQMRQQIPELHPSAVTEALIVSAEQASRMFLFQLLRSLISSAVRLHVIGPLGGQALQYQLSPFAEEVFRQGSSRSLDDVVQTAPLLEIFQGTQDRMYSRLFQS